MELLFRMNGTIIGVVFKFYAISSYKLLDHCSQCGNSCWRERHYYALLKTFGNV